MPIYIVWTREVVTRCYGIDAASEDEARRKYEECDHDDPGQDGETIDRDITHIERLHK